MIHHGSPGYFPEQTSDTSGKIHQFDKLSLLGCDWPDLEILKEVDLQETRCFFNGFWLLGETEASFMHLFNPFLHIVLYCHMLCSHNNC